MAIPTIESLYSNYEVTYRIPAILAAERRNEPGVTLKRLPSGSYLATEFVTADSVLNAQLEITGRGGEVLLVKKQVQSIWNKEVITKEYRQQFLRALKFNVEAGQSPGRALAGTVTAEVNPRIRLILNPALAVVNRGGSFAEAIGHLGLFSRATLAILQAGEKTGKMAEAIDAALGQYSKSQMMWAKFIGAMTWLVMDVGMALSMLIGVQLTMIPMLKGMGPGDGASKEALTKFNHSLALGSGFNLFLLVIALVAIAAVLGVLVAYFSTRDQAKKEKIESIFYKIPLIKPFLQHTSLSESMSVASSMLNGGVGLLDAAEIASSATAFPSVRRYWSSAIAAIFTGDAVAAALAKAPLSPSEQMSINSHKNTKQLASTLTAIAEKRHMEAEKANRKLVMWTMAITMIYSALPIFVLLALLFLLQDSTMGSIASMSN